VQAVIGSSVYFLYPIFGNFVIADLCYLSFIFFFIVVSIYMAVSFYGFFYLGPSLDYSYYSTVLLLFVLSMLGVVLISPSLLFVLFWDFLGASRFLLILFYLTEDRVVGSVRTSVTMRVGDLFLIYLVLQNTTSSYSSSFYVESLSALLLFIAVFSKRAQFPFIGWLPRAIRAPTPVSALVHSSTLVTAGVVLGLHYRRFFVNYCFFTSGLFTSLIASLFLSGFIAIWELDLKKLVAFSTLSQLRLCLISLSLGMTLECYLHIVGHALVKSVLFLQVGYLIFSTCGQQHFLSRGSIVATPLTRILKLSCLLGLCGLLFSSSSTSKELLVGSSCAGIVDYLYTFLFFSSISITFFYSLRIWWVSYQVILSSVLLSLRNRFFLTSCLLSLFSLLFVY